MNMPFDGAQFGRDLVIEFRKYVERVVKPLEERTLELQQKVKQLEERPGVKYVGTWRFAEFDAGDVCTYGGSMWYATTKTQAKPGTSDDWVLCVRRGRDGRDAGQRTPHDQSGD